MVHIDNLTPGMVLSRNVCDRSGRMLLPAGAELTDKHFSIFRMWGVLEVEVAGDAVVEDAETPAPLNLEIDPERLAEARAEMERLFIYNDPEHPAIKELMRICTERRATRAA
ncbi:hypothetical protein M1B72_03740 [Geomonas paludis]|uniref:Uncharacterized protein n=1 Tax=Geomonas paludis TaxID=2740185 RepID=A0ABY4LL75_9BACT|nr:hypothetical protein [Geomonas paludis]UPU38250.1 hypothetical protein M1B72_03740 [Geomonas paludis]